MKYGSIRGIDRDVSRLFMGVDNQETIGHAASMFDDFLERGGNAFDTAYIYRDGECEKLLGQWVTGRGFFTERARPDRLDDPLLV